MNRAYIPPKDCIHSTCDVDGVNTAFGYWGPLSYPMRRRLDMAVQTMRKPHYERILDAGYGCGIFLPDLYKRLSPDGKLYGVDVHDEHNGVKDKLLAQNIELDKVELMQSSLAELPIEDNFFDLIVSVSVLEHITPDLLRACLAEIKRVAKPDADIIIGFPTDCFFIKLLATIQKQDLKENHPSTHNDIFSAIKDSGFSVEKQIGFPIFWGPLTMHYNTRLNPLH